MASTSGEIPEPPAPDEAEAPDYEQRLINLLGPTKGPDVYQYILGIISLLDDVRDPPLSATLRAYVRAEGIDPKLIVPDEKGGFITANNTEHASQLRERVRLARREQLFSRVAEIGSAILRAPQ